MLLSPYQRSTAITEKGFVLFELLIAMTLLAGSFTVLHTIYASVVAKQIQLQKSHDEFIKRTNQYEIAMARHSTLRQVQIKQHQVSNSFRRR